MNSITKKLFLSIFLATMALIFTMQLTAETARADTRCRIDLGFGNWTEGCPHRHIPAPQPSCLSVYTNTFYEFNISNETGPKVYYSINGDRYELNNGYYRTHKYQKAYGTNSCNTKTYNKPLIKFDYSYASGYQERSYSVGTFSWETFKRSGNGLDLYH